jgi:hypothetical protein
MRHPIVRAIEEGKPFTKLGGGKFVHVKVQSGALDCYNLLKNATLSPYCAI